MAWGRLLQLGRPLTRSPLTEISRSFSSVVETFRQSSNAVGREPGAEVMGRSASGEGGGVDAVVCGRGDKKTKRGKRFKGSFGNCRPKKGTSTQRLRENWELSVSLAMLLLCWQYALEACFPLTLTLDPP